MRAIIFLVLLSIIYAGFFTDNVKLTKEGGVAVQMTNKLGTNSIKGQLVSVSELSNNWFILCTNQFDAVGVVYENKAHGLATWIVISGICDVFISNSAATNGNWVTANNNGTISANTLAPAGGYEYSAEMFKGIGYSLSTTTAASTNKLIRIILKLK